MKSIVWLGPMGDDSVTKKAIDLREYGVKELCKKYGFDLIIPDTVEATNWFVQLKKSISAASGIICDISGERPNVYFEIGFALALKIPSILLCQSQTKVHVDLKNIQHHEYEGIADVYETLEQWLGSLAELDRVVLIDQMSRRLVHPIKILEGDGVHEYIYADQIQERELVLENSGIAPLTLDTIEEADPDIGEILKKINGLQELIAEKNSRPLFNGALIGYVSHTPRRDDSARKLGARIKYRETDYYTFIATHFPLEALDDALKQTLITPPEARDLRSEINTAMQAGKWPYARPLTVTVYVILSKDPGEFIIFQNRERNRNFHARYPMQATAAGMIHISRIPDSKVPSVLVPEKAFVHELHEEVGLGCDHRDIKILGLITEEVSNKIGFVGYVRISEE